MKPPKTCYCFFKTNSMILLFQYAEKKKKIASSHTTKLSI